ncbi:MAG: methylenetetrahydrofolate reductase, partial [Chloroflexota bacterium]
IVGAAALGITNVLCLTGDGVQTGDHPQAKPVFDMDSVQAIQMTRHLRDKSAFLSGRELAEPPRMLIGGASNPFAPPFHIRARRLQKKIQAGADFVQSQYCYDVPRFKQFMQQARNMGLHNRVAYMVGVGPVKSPKTARWMRENVPGVWIPDDIIDRLEKTPKKQRKAEGIKVCAEIIEQVREIEGVRGVHIMAYRQEDTIPEILRQTNLLPVEPEPEEEPIPVSFMEFALSGNLLL